MLMPISFKYRILEMEKVTQFMLLLCLTIFEVINMVICYEFGTYQNSALTMGTDCVGLDKIIEYYQ